MQSRKPSQRAARIERDMRCAEMRAPRRARDATQSIDMRILIVISAMLPLSPLVLIRHHIIFARFHVCCYICCLIFHHMSLLHLICLLSFLPLLFTFFLAAYGCLQIAYTAQVREHERDARAHAESRSNVDRSSSDFRHLLRFSVPPALSLFRPPQDLPLSAFACFLLARLILPSPFSLPYDADSSRPDATIAINMTLSGAACAHRARGVYAHAFARGARRRC